MSNLEQIHHEALRTTDCGPGLDRRLDPIECVLAKSTHQAHTHPVALHPVLLEKLNAALLPGVRSTATPRDARLAPVPNKVHAVIGMRRSGKTTFLRQLMDAQRTQVPPERAVYLSFDDDRLAELQLAQLGFLLEEYFRRHPELRGREPVHWFLDEIQLVSGWERFVRRLLDSERMEIVVSGSSARMLSREVHTSLRGRGLATVIRPFSFREFLRHRGEEPADHPRTWTARTRSAIEKRFREFLLHGGFPEVQGLPLALGVELLQGYVDTVLFRDVIERYGISQVAALRWLVRHCLRAPAGHMSVHRLHQDLKSQGHGVAKDALHMMLGHVIDGFLLSAVPLATDSERQRNSNSRKLYPADPGLIRAFDASGRSNVGHALETCVFNELERRGAEVGYVKTEGGSEVDFLARYPDGAQELIQVCADPADDRTRTRELRALTEAAVLHPRARPLLLVLDRDGVASLTHETFQITAAYEWMLGAWA